MKYQGEPPELADIPAFSELDALRMFCIQRAKNSVWAEFGVQNGLSARFWQQFLPPFGRLYLFDSFEGLPGPWYAKKGVGHRKTNQIPRFSDPRVILKVGLFEDTLPVDDLLGFVHIDCDIYSSTKTVLDNIYVTKGSIILFDELWGYGEGPNSEAWRDHEYKALKEWDRQYKFIARDDRYAAAIEILE
jgi:hypothetical protein